MEVVVFIGIRATGNPLSTTNVLLTRTSVLT
jgi:hypothetical protein